MSNKKFKSLQEFYPYYLSEHQNTTSRVLHFTGTGLFLFSLLTAFLFHDYRIFIFSPLLAYALAWTGHFFFEKNKPATFKYPFYSLASDFILFYDILFGNEPFKVSK